MDQSSWIQQRKKTRRIWLAALLVLSAAAVILIVHNNLDSSSAAGAQRLSPAQRALAQRTEKPVNSPAVSHGMPSGNDGVDVPFEHQRAPEPRESIIIPGVDCELADRKDLTVILSLELFFQGDSLKDEILLEREQLKVMVRRVLARRSLDEVLVEPLRAEIQQEINSRLHNGSVSDIEFRDFRIARL